MLGILDNDPSDYQVEKKILGGGNSNILGIFIHTWGNDSQFHEHIFQMGWETTTNWNGSEFAEALCVVFCCVSS